MSFSIRSERYLGIFNVLRHYHSHIHVVIGRNTVSPHPVRPIMSEETVFSIENGKKRQVHYGEKSTDRDSP